MLALLVALIALVVAAPAVAQVQVHMDIGFHLPAPPRLVVVPQVPAVQYVPTPAAPGNLFFYNGQYWAFSAGGWYMSESMRPDWLASPCGSYGPLSQMTNISMAVMRPSFANPTLRRP